MRGFGQRRHRQQGLRRHTAQLTALLIGGALAAGATTASAPAAKPPPEVQLLPNIVLVLLDDARYDDMSTMPDVRRRIGDAGATFTSFYSSFPLCCPARATLLTGQYPHNHGVLSNKAPAGGFRAFDDTDTLATALDPKYRTGLIGKYFNEYAPPYQPPGWNEWMVPKAMYNYVGSRWYIDQGSGGGLQVRPGYQTDTMGDLAVDFIDRNASAVEPFFLYTSVVAPHAGNPAEADDPPGIATPAVSAEHRDVFAALRMADPSFDEADVSDKPLQPPPLSAAEIAGLSEANAQRREAELSAQTTVNRILDAVEASGEGEDTYVMFMSDNGYILGEHRIRGGKVQPYEVSAKVPFMVRGPGIEPGTVIDDFTAQVDFAPTVLSMAAALPSGQDTMDGIDLLPRLTGIPLSTDRAVVLEATDTKATDSPLPWLYHGVVQDGWKYVDRVGRRDELYDLRQDPFELENLSGLAAHVERQTSLANQLAEFQWCAGDSCR